MVVPAVGRLVLAMAIGAFAVMPSACGADDGPPRPPDIVYGQDVCDECNMIISDERFAAAYVLRTAAGRWEPRVFDDIGDMLVHAAVHPEHDVAAWYVHDYATLSWLDATTAHFVHSDRLSTPMAMGMAAHASRDAALVMASELEGEVLGWSFLRRRYAMAGAGP